MIENKIIYNRKQNKTYRKNHSFLIAHVFKKKNFVEKNKTEQAMSNSSPETKLVENLENDLEKLLKLSRKLPQTEDYYFRADVSQDFKVWFLVL